jgi:hypothetical protein
MALAQVSAAYKDAIGSVYKTIHQEHSVYSSRAHHADNTDMGRILKTRHPGRVSRRIAAPVA